MTYIVVGVEHGRLIKRTFSNIEEANSFQDKVCGETYLFCCANGTQIHYCSGQLANR